MPLSRARKRHKRQSSYGRTASESRLRELTIEAIFDRDRSGRRHRGPRVLYHYTSWEAAESIIASQMFRATAHNCTNDRAELTSADATILEAVSAVHRRATGITSLLLQSFLDTYEYSRIGVMPRCYLICFSKTRDDPHQWCEYGTRGSGVCLGLRLFEIPKPKVAALTSQFMPVYYRESEWRAGFEQFLGNFIDAVAGKTDTEDTRRLASDSLTLIATAWGLTAKVPQWEREREVRMIFLVREHASPQPTEEILSDGSVKRYLTVPVTALRRMPIVEVIAGPNNDSATARERAIRMLQGAGYREVSSKVVVSSMVLECESKRH